MKKFRIMMIASCIATVAATSFVFAGCGGSSEKTWVYAAITLNSSDSNVGSIYYAESYFSTSRINPTTVQVYTEDEISAIKQNAKEGAAGYRFDVPQNAVIGITAYNSDTIFWFDSVGAEALVKHADALVLGSDGTLKSADGQVVAAPLK